MSITRGACAGDRLPAFACVRLGAGEIERAREVDRRAGDQDEAAAAGRAAGILLFGNSTIADLLGHS